MRWSLVLLVCACRAQISDGPGGDDIANLIDAQPTGTIDAPPDAVILGAWGPSTAIPGASSTKAEDDCTMSSSTNELVFAVVEGSTKHLWMQSRTSPAAPWDPPLRLPFNGPASTTDQSPRFSADDLTLFFGSDRAGGAGKGDIWMVTRPTVGGTWGPPADDTQVSTAADERWFMTCGDGTHYVIGIVNTATSTDLYEGTLGAAPTPIGELNSTASDTSPFVTADCLTIFFASTRDSMTALYTSTRTAIGATWTAPALVTDFGLTGEQDPWMSADQRTFIFASNAAGNNDIYISTR